MMLPPFIFKWFLILMFGDAFLKLLLINNIHIFRRILAVRFPTKKNLGRK